VGRILLKRDLKRGGEKSRKGFPGGRVLKAPGNYDNMESPYLKGDVRNLQKENSRGKSY